jgi:hypothetical protein
MSAWFAWFLRLGLWHGWFGNAVTEANQQDGYGGE